MAATLVLPAAAAEASHAQEPNRTSPRAGTVHPRSDAWEAKVLRLTNARRAAHGRKPLKASSCADKFAESWTRHMASREVLKHQSLTPFFTCPHTSYAGENIAEGYSTPRALVSAWMHSPGHRANILSPHFHRIGIAGWVSKHGVTYATQDFLG
jgi:uncharacterized protein YkwD